MIGLREGAKWASATSNWIKGNKHLHIYKHLCAKTAIDRLHKGVLLRLLNSYIKKLHIKKEEILIEFQHSTYLLSYSPHSLVDNINNKNA